MFCSEKPIVASNALIKPIISKEISVTVAIATPVIIGIRDKYTWKKFKNIKRCYLSTLSQILNDLNLYLLLVFVFHAELFLTELQ